MHQNLKSNRRIMKLINKTMLTALVTLSTASVYYAQEVKKDTLDNSKDIQEVVLTRVADIAKDRKTPVAVSTIKEAQIVQRLGNQEFPEILNTTPSVYTTKGGGGFGDGRINIRGFDTNNTAVMINGVPVNDMEGGTVYFSNWQGLSDVTSAMQVQRGLGSSKLAIASVGGTINILTRAADKKKEGTVTLGLGNDGYLKTLFSYNTGKSEKGWSTSFLMSRTAGSTYIDGSKFEGYNYYFALGYQPNKKHDFQFTFTGAPQWHNQPYQNTISTLMKYGKDGKPSRTYNQNWGYLDGREFSQTINYYSKPIMSVNWDWNINEKSKLSTVLYASWGRGGGTGILGSINGKNNNYPTDPTKSLPRTADGLIRWDDIITWNQGGHVADFGADNKTPYLANSGNGFIQRSNVNSHDWYGFLTNFQHKVNENLSFSAGLDGRYYYGYHPGIVTNFLGNTSYLEKGDLNQPAGYYVTQSQNAAPSANPFAKAVKDNSQVVNRNYDGEVMWLGAFGQVEYSNDRISAFLQGSLSNQGLQRIDHWVVDGVTQQQGQVVNEKTGFKNIWGYNAKGGVNFNIDEKNNVFANIGYYSKQPNNYAVYPYAQGGGRQGNQQILNQNLTNEKIFSGELGYGFRSSKLRANLNLYYTTWNDRYVRVTGINIENIQGATAALNGVNELHMGAELEATYTVNKFLEFNGMFSMGDWKYKSNPTSLLYDQNGIGVTTANGTNSVELALKNVKVSDAAQTTAAIGATVKPVNGLSIYGTWRYYDRYYSTFSIDKNFIIVNGVTPPAAQNGALKMPSYNLTDVGFSYEFKMRSGDRFIVGANIYNLFDTYYISDGKSSIKKTVADFKDIAGGATAQQQLDAYNANPNNFYKGIDVNNTIYMGFGRTWSASISYKF